MGFVCWERDTGHILIRLQIFGRCTRLIDAGVGYCRLNIVISLNRAMKKMNDLILIQDFHQELSRKFPYVKSENWARLQEISMVKHLEKGEIFLRHGDRLNFGIFVVTGWLKLFYLDERGNERIAAFCDSLEYIDNWNAIHQQQALPYSISAITSTTLILYPLEKMVNIFDGEPDLLQLCIHLSQEMIKMRQVHYEVLTLRSPEERYRHLMKYQRKWLNEISLTDLAKYLHLSREALSRARNHDY